MKKTEFERLDENVEKAFCALENAYWKLDAAVGRLLNYERRENERRVISIRKGTREDTH